MGARHFHASQPRSPLRSSRFELALQVAPFMLELPARDRQPTGDPGAADPGSVEAVAPVGSLALDGAQILCDCARRSAVLLEAQQLRMPGVAPGLSQKHRLREERLAPESDETFGVEVRRVQAPEPHYVPAGTRAACNETIFLPSPTAWRPTSLKPNLE